MIFPIIYSFQRNEVCNSQQLRIILQRKHCSLSAFLPARSELQMIRCVARTILLVLTLILVFDNAVIAQFGPHIPHWPYHEPSSDELLDVGVGPCPNGCYRVNPIVGSVTCLC